MTQKALVLGGTGAMGIYLVPTLLERGFKVHVTSRTKRASENDNLKYIQGDGHDSKFLKRILQDESYHTIIDFMNYGTDEFRDRYELLLKSCSHYIFLSSYRVFADSPVITERSPRLLDVSTDREFLETDEYALAKARQEDILRNSRKSNWTIVRPAITYSQGRFQLGSMEADTFVYRALQDIPVVLPKKMLQRTTTMTWAGDVARLIAKLVMDKKAFGEDFNIATSEHHTWSEVITIYKETLNLKVQTTSLQNYIEAMGGGFSTYQVMYDRMFNRVLDNSKILQITGEKQDNFTSLREGLNKELTEFIKKPVFKTIDYATQARFDRLTHSQIDLSKADSEEKRIYMEVRHPHVTRLRRVVRLRTRLRNLKRKVRIRTRIRNLIKGVHRGYMSPGYRRADGVILTMTGYYNYGNIIQRYALQEFLRQKGYKYVSYWVDETPEDEIKNGRFRYVAPFVERHIWKKSFDPNDDFRTYIVGSDQVWRNWNYGDEKTGLGYYFLNFVKNPGAKRIAYAASIGKGSLKEAGVSPEFVEYIRPFVKKFDAIAMREESGIEIVRKTWGVQAEHVLDPTMLLDAGDYNKLIDKSLATLEPAKPVFAYILGVDPNKSKLLSNIVQATGWAIEELNLLEMEVLPPVEQWLRNLRDAELVVTDSFHGAVFSIINNTPLVVVENDHGGIARMRSLLKMFGLEDRLVMKDRVNRFEIEKLKPIDWADVNGRLDKLRKRSAEWLMGALQDGKTVAR